MHRLIVSGSVAACLLVIGCSVGTHSEFRQTQARFSPRPGRSPRVYLYLAEVPDLPLRSVGVIWVSVPARHGIKGVAEAAADRGRRVGVIPDRSPPELARAPVRHHR